MACWAHTDASNAVWLKPPLLAPSREGHNRPMRMKLIVAAVADDKTDSVIEAARAGGATGATVVSRGRGEGLKPQKTFLGMDLAAQTDLLLFLVVEPQAREILERIRDAAHLDDEHGAGVAFQLAIEDVVGLTTQMPVMRREVGDAL